MKKLLIVLSLCFLAACVSSGPKKTLDAAATALENKDSKAFLAQFDMQRYAAAHLQNVTRNNPALRTLNDMGQMLGIGGMSDVLGSMVDVAGELTSEFNRGVSTGELALACKEDSSPNCPWVARSLRDAKVKELDANAAIAQVTSPSNIASWLALRKVGDTWLIVGHAPLEQQAGRYALGVTEKAAPQQGDTQGQQAPKAPGQEKPEKPTPM